jgi:hypothetical protein
LREEDLIAEIGAVLLALDQERDRQPSGRKLREDAKLALLAASEGTRDRDIRLEPLLLSRQTQALSDHVDEAT